MGGLVSAQVVADAIGVRQGRTVTEWARKGVVPFAPHGKQMRFDLAVAVAAYRAHQSRPPPGTRTCKVCSRELPIAEFRSGRRADGTREIKYDCRECHKAYNRSLRERDAAAKEKRCQTQEEREANWAIARREKTRAREAAILKYLAQLDAWKEERVRLATLLASSKTLPCWMCKEKKTRRAFRAAELNAARTPSDLVCRRCARIAENRRYATDPEFHASVKAKKLRRRRLLAGVKCERVVYSVVAERDGWRCGICGGKVTRRTWSLDHVVPVSKGGAHTYSNVVLAHRTCNSARGVGRLAVQAPLFARAEAA